MKTWTEQRGSRSYWCGSCGAMTEHDILRDYRDRLVCRWCLPISAPGIHAQMNLWKDRIKQQGTCEECGKTAPVTREKSSVPYVSCQACGTREDPLQKRTTPPEGLQDEALSWEILPPGTLLDRIRSIRDGSSELTEENKERAERLAFIDSLEPLRWWRGIPLRGNREYFVAEFDRCVIADSPTVGNAIYLYGKEPETTAWQDVFGGTKTNALALGARRIVHQGEWQTKLREAKLRYGA